MRNWLDNDEISILSSAKRSGARIEGCELGRFGASAAPFDTTFAPLRSTQDACY